MLTVYSAIFGPIDDPEWILSSAPLHATDTRFILFTDQLAPGRIERHVTWDLCLPVWTSPKPRLTARYHKLNSLLVLPADTTLSLWLDGTQQIRPGVDLRRLCAASLGDRWIAAHRHPKRDCLYAEELACARQRKDDPQVMQQQTHSYLCAGYPEHHGLAETTCVIRRPHPRLAQFEQHWWREVSTRSCRDQLSFNFVAWNLGVEYGIVPGSCLSSAEFAHRRHRGAGAD